MCQPDAARRYAAVAAHGSGCPSAGTASHPLPAKGAAARHAHSRFRLPGQTLDFIVTDAEIAESQGALDFLQEQKLLTSHIDAASYYDRGPLTIAQKQIAAGDLPDLSKIVVAG